VSRTVLPERAPAVLLLDAGNTVVFFDDDAAAQVLAGEGARVEPARLRAAHGAAKRAYEQLLASGVSHAAGWGLYGQELLRAAGLPEGRLVELVGALRAEHDRLNLWRRVPGEVPGALERLRAAGIRIGMVSNSEGMIARLVADVGLARFFEVIVDSGTEGVSKPDPEIFRRALARMGAPAETATYVGDVPSVDVDGARAAGLSAILIDAFDHYPDYTDAPRIRSLAELAEKWTALRT
jgi:putative hydrolase of the HAD superfamily